MTLRGGGWWEGYEQISLKYVRTHTDIVERFLGVVFCAYAFIKNTSN